MMSMSMCVNIAGLLMRNYMPDKHEKNGAAAREGSRFGMYGLMLL